MSVAAIVPAAGSGRRMEQQEKKPYLHLLGKPLLAWVLAVLDKTPEVHCIIIPVCPGDEMRCKQEIVDPLGLRTPVVIVAGGAQRQDSVRNGLAAVPDTCDTVLVHDAARPLVTCALIQTAIAATRTHRATTLAVPVKDTIATVDPAWTVLDEIPDRSRLVSIQTPQTFAKDLLREAHRAAVVDGVTATDDTSLVSRLGIPVAVVPGAYSNIKITTQEDLAIAAALLEQGLL
ncbi:MAG: 2-C-methyl-D-erythritol 4-phosphate cytidylyltransferase [Desulfobacterota bacterium]|nr:2-C-methyl-D-erythritol 4-phosphate cytidylyltransferase [Thermodesulfobacteriota bacterium]